MRAAVTSGPGSMALQDLQEPVAGRGQAVIRVDVVGLCGSDIHLFRGDHPYATFPQVQGHEFSGTIVAFGPGYEGPLSVGESVAVEPLLPCGACFACRRGHPNCCAQLAVMGAHVGGALAERMVVPISCCYPVGDLSPELAALVEPLSIGLQAVVRSGAAESDQVLVLGAGPIGQAVTVSAADRGAEVMVVDRLENRLELATRLGASRVLDVTVAPLEETVASWTGGDGPAIVIDATGVPGLIRKATEVVAPSGTVVVVGISMSDVALSVLDFTRKELNVLGSRNNAGLFPDSVQLVRRSQGRVAQLITHRFSFEEAPRAMELLRDHPEQTEKVLVMVDEPTRREPQ